MKALKQSLILALAVFLTLACGTAENTGGNANQPAANSNSGSAPPQAVVVNLNANSPAQPQAASAAGAAIYAQQNCAMCHGADGKGNPKMKDVPDFTNAAWQQKETDADFANMIKNGKKPMPAYGSKLNDEQIKALVAHVRSFAR
jgi:cytochrome c oxidase cbb3-type subunit 3